MSSFINAFKYVGVLLHREIREKTVSVVIMNRVADGKPNWLKSLLTINNFIRAGIGTSLKTMVQWL